MNLESANEVALAALKRLQAQVGVPRQTGPTLSANVTQLISDYRSSGVHNTLHTVALGVYDRWIVSLKEPTPGTIQLQMNDIEANRDQQLTAEIRSETELNAVLATWYPKIEWWRSRLTPTRLQPGTRYRVQQAFTDNYANKFEAGTVLTFVERHYLPYHGGNTFVFKEVNIYLQDEENSHVRGSELDRR